MQADLDAGEIVNVASASNGVVTSPPDTVRVEAVQKPSLVVVKSSPTTSLSAPQTVNYSYLVTNTGNVTVTGIALSDDNDNNNLSCPQTTLAPTASMTCTATHTFTQAELDANGSPTAGSGRAGEHGHGDLGPGAAGDGQPRDPDRPVPGVDAREVGVTAVVQPGGPGDHLHVRGDEHRQRDRARADLGDGRQGDGGLPADGVAGAGPVGDLHRVAHGDAGRPRRGPDRERRPRRPTAWSRRRPTR